LPRKEDCPTGPTRKRNGLVVWSTKASRTPCTPPFNAGNRGRRLPPAAHAGRHPLVPRSGRLSKSATGPRSFRARSRCWTVLRGVPRRPALQRHSRSAPAGVYDLIAPATGYCATASCVRIRTEAAWCRQSAIGRSKGLCAPPHRIGHPFGVILIN
jgi:hypothetical protein